MGNAIELVVVATGFADEEVKTPVLPSDRVVVPPVGMTDSGADAVLEPIKPLPPKGPRINEQVVLGAPSTRYRNIDQLLSKPAYQSRNSQFVVQTPGRRKEVLRDKTAETKEPSKEDSGSGSLFD